MNFSDVELPSNRKFGLTFTALLSLLGTYFWFRQSIDFAFIAFGVGLGFLLVTSWKAELLTPINKVWMRFGLLLGMIVSPIVLGVIFFGLFATSGFLMRLFGRDELGLKFKAKQTYWKNRNPDELSSTGFQNQF